jgi:hypothetical protein
MRSEILAHRGDDSNKATITGTAIITMEAGQKVSDSLFFMFLRGNPVIFTDFGEITGFPRKIHRVSL